LAGLVGRAVWAARAVAGVAGAALYTGGGTKLGRETVKKRELKL